MQVFAKFSFIISSCLSFLILPIIVLTFLMPYYTDAFARYHVYDSFTASQGSVEILNARFGKVLAYIQPPFNSVLDHSFFSAEDIKHMQDVQAIFVYLYVVLAIAICTQIASTVFLMLKSYRDDTARLLAVTERATGIILILIIVFGLIFLLTWDRSFILFHQVLFPNNTYWNLDPATSNLIKFLPGNIFQELSLLYLGALVFEYITWKIGTFAYKMTYT